MKTNFDYVIKPVLKDKPTNANKTLITVTGMICQAKDQSVFSDNFGITLKRASIAKIAVKSSSISL